GGTLRSGLVPPGTGGPGPLRCTALERSMNTISLIHAAHLLRHTSWILGSLALLAAVGWGEAWAAGVPPEPQGRSMVVTRFGIVASSQVLASRAGAQVLELGGNPVESAIPAHALLGGGGALS